MEMIGRADDISNQLSDTQLVKRIRDGENKLFEIIIRRYNQRLYRVGMAVLGSDLKVEDAMQAAYISAYEHLSQFEERSAFITWLTRIMLNQCYEQRRRDLLREKNHTEPDNAVNMKTPAHILVNKELSSALENAIGQLPEKYRLVFVLREMEDLSVKETSEALHIEEQNVKVRLNRAKTMLRSSLEGHMKEHVYSFHLSRCDRIVNYVMRALGLNV